MSSTLSKQSSWWPRKSSKSSTVAYRTKSSPTAPPQPLSKSSPVPDEKQMMRAASSSKPSSKFNTLASAIGLKSKKSSHPILDIQDPPPSFSTYSTPTPSRIPSRAGSSSNRPTLRAAASPHPNPSRALSNSWEDPSEPLTPSDSSLHLSAYRPSRLTMLDYDPFAASVQRNSAGALVFPSTDPNRLSVVSDPHLSDLPPSKTEPSPRSLRSSHTSSSTYNNPLSSFESRSMSSKTAASPSSTSGRKPFFRNSVESEKFAQQEASPHSKSNDFRASDLPGSFQRRQVPSSTNGDIQRARSTLMSFPAVNGNLNMSAGERSDWNHDRHGEKDLRKELEKSVSLNDSPSQDTAARPSPVPKLSESLALPVRKSSPNVSMSSISSHSQTVMLSHSGSTHSLPRHGSGSRLRSTSALPPTPAPPPTHDLPPTPGSTSVSSTLIRSPLSTSSTSLAVSPLSVDTQEPSLVSLDLPPLTPSSGSQSLRSLSFAHDREIDDFNNVSYTPPSSRLGHFDVRGPVRSTTSTVRKEMDASPFQRQLTKPMHGPRPSTSSSIRGETPTPRALKKCVSQQSLGPRTRVESSASASSAVSVESTGHGSGGKVLKKQRSLHNTISSTAASLASAPPLRHASSTGLSSPASAANAHSHRKDEAATLGSSRRSVPSNPPATWQGNPLTTPQKKRALFSHSGVRDRRDSNNGLDDRDRDDARSCLGLPGDTACASERSKKGHNGRGSGLGISLGLGFPSFANPFFSAPLSPPSPPTEPYALPTPQTPSSFWDQPSSPGPTASPSSPGLQTPERLGEHIIPPAELLRIEALVDTEPPPSPAQFSYEGGGSGNNSEDEWGIPGSDAEKPRAPMASASSNSPALAGRASEGRRSGPSSAPPSLTHHFTSPSGSIQERLQTNSRLPTRHSSVIIKTPLVRGVLRPSTSQELSRHASRVTPKDISPLAKSFTKPNSLSGVLVSPTSLPPPPRKRGSAVSSSAQHHHLAATNDVPFHRLTPPPSRSNLRQARRLPSDGSLPRRSSISKKPSFLNIDDDCAESMGVIVTLPDDSFLDLERGKESLDIARETIKAMV